MSATFQKIETAIASENDQFCDQHSNKQIIAKPPIKYFNSLLRFNLFAIAFDYDFLIKHKRIQSQQLRLRKKM